MAADETERLRKENEALRSRNQELTRQFEAATGKLEDAVLGKFDANEKLSSIPRLMEQNEKLKQIILQLREELALERDKLDVLTMKRNQRKAGGG